MHQRSSNFHGNAGSIAGRGGHVQPWLEAGYGALLLSYRGYGGSEGRPTEDRLYADARAAIAYVLAQGVAPDRLVLYGESLGTGVAVKMAVEHDVAAVVLEAPFTSAVDVGAEAYWILPVRWMTRRWARRGTRPRAPRDQRTEWAYIFGAICPAKGKGAGLVMPWCDTDAMAAHLIEISAAVDPGAQAVLIVDQAGWHLTPKLAIPDNITVLALPPRSPELNPVENVWQFMRDNWLSNRIFKSYEDIVALCCQAWNNLIDQPWKIMSLGMRKWAHGF